MTVILRSRLSFVEVFGIFCDRVRRYTGRTREFDEEREGGQNEVRLKNRSILSPSAQE